MRPFLFYIAAFVVTAASAARGETLRWASPEAQTSLIELYTSEGCSSCPRAEQWLGRLRDEPGLWREFVPLAFHVDYWDGLGWRDRFSAKAYTEREYAYASAWRGSSVYTPCFVQDGLEWHRDGALRRSKAKVGVLTATYDGASLRADFAFLATGLRTADLEIHAALLGGGIISKVLAGENRGEALAHEFVVLAIADGAWGTPILLPRRSIEGVHRYAVAVWVTRRGELTALQATGGWLE
jgi:hypothetical protein